MNATSPLTGLNNCKCIETISSAHLIELYKSSYNVDVEDHFKGIESIYKYKCLDTGLDFFVPSSVAGTEELYESLQEFEWFYKENKWEYEKATRFVKPGYKVLDVGCGHGHFLNICNDLGAESFGLEFNERAVLAATNNGLNVFQESIESHSSKSKEKYDLVCTFQVLEHVTDINSFLTSCLKVVKPGGLFLVGVPNNDSFLKFAKTNCLNMPPHHMSLWTSESLESVQRYYKCELHSIETEPLHEADWFQAVMEERYITSRIAKLLYYRFGARKVFSKFVNENAKSIAGHTILAVYTKI